MYKIFEIIKHNYLRLLFLQKWDYKEILIISFN